jgi:LysM repeat protein
MKNLLFSVLSIFLLQNLGAQDAPLFLYAKTDCANRMEYRYNGHANAGIVTYSMRPTQDQLFLFDMGAEGNTTFKALPKGTLSCSESNLTEEIVLSINSGSRKGYILRDVQGGYSVSPIAQATQIVKSGSIYNFKSHNLDFTMDTDHLTTGENLAKKGSGAYVFYNGLYYSDCHSVYTLRREPDEACLTKTDFDFIPSLGILSERTGTGSAQTMENEYRLSAVNGYASIDYLLAMCKGAESAMNAPATNPTVVSQTEYILPIQYATNIEPDKESAVIGVAPTPVQYSKPTFVGPRPLVDCPEKPGEGYHIVQPGETLNGIARAYQIKVGAIINWNGLKDPDMLQTCQKVYITAPPGGVKTGIDQKTGNLVIADKPTKKGKKDKSKGKKSVAPAPVTHSTENVAVAKPKPAQAPTKEDEVTPQYKHWAANKETKEENVRIQYVYVPTPIATKSVESPAEYAYQPAQTTTKEVEIRKSGAGITHTVLAGESLYSISRMYGFTPERFRKMNGLPESYTLRPGMKLMTSDCSCEIPRQTTIEKGETFIQKSNTQNKGGTFEEVDVIKPLEFNVTSKPSKSGKSNSGRFVEHTVREGDTLGTISKRYNTTTDDIIEANPIELTETLIAGMRLLIPR